VIPTPRFHWRFTLPSNGKCNPIVVWCLSVCCLATRHNIVIWSSCLTVHNNVDSWGCAFFFFTHNLTAMWRITLSNSLTEPYQSPLTDSGSQSQLFHTFLCCAAWTQLRLLCRGVLRSCYMHAILGEYICVCANDCDFWCSLEQSRRGGGVKSKCFEWMRCV
jgi:hypothetical protein